MDERDLKAANILADGINDLLLKLPGYRVVTNGHKVQVVAGDATFHDAGLDYVAEFHKVFGSFHAVTPGLPEYGFISRSLIVEYHTAAEFWGERLKSMAQRQAEAGDKGGSLLLIRLQLCQEELAELAEAMIAKDLVGCLDALTDMTYVADGTFHTLGLGHYKLAALAEVHRSNMSKLGPDGVPVVSSAGRIVKGPSYSPPDLAAVLGSVNSREPGEFGDGVTVGRE